MGTLGIANERLQKAVRDRGWSSQAVTDQLNELAVMIGERGVLIDERTVRGWLNGRGGKPATPRPVYVRLLCLLFQRGPQDLGLPDPTRNGSGLSEMRDEPDVLQTLELSRRATTTDLPEPELVSHERAVDRLCTEYGDTPPDQLIPRVVDRLFRIDRLRDRRVGHDAYRRIQAAAGWAHLLLAACYTDLGQADVGWSSRDAAEYLGREAGNADLVGWSYETASWISLWQGNVFESLDAALEGRRVAPVGSGSWLMNTCKIASARGKLGQRDEVDREFASAFEALEQRGAEPENPQHHFQFDSPKVHQYAADAYAWLHDPELTARHSQAVIDWAGDPAARTWNPTRTATAEVNFGQSMFDRGDLGEAVNHSLLAFDTFLRRDTIVRAAELDEQIQKRWPREPSTRELHDQVAAAKRSLGIP